MHNCKKLCDPRCHQEICTRDYSRPDSTHCRYQPAAACEPGHPNYMWAVLNCKHKCNVGCSDPEVIPDRKLGAVNHIPLADVEQGHQFCEDKYTILTLPGETRHFAVPESRRVAVCGNCLSDQFLLHPAYASGGKVFGVCVPIEDDHLMRTLGKELAEMPPKCLKFVGGHGMYIAPDGWGKHTHADSSSVTASYVIAKLIGEQIPTAGVAFTCVEVVKKKWFNEVQNLRVKGRWYYIALIFMALTRKIVECHSVDEKFATKPKLKCVNHKKVISCKSRRITLNQSGDAAAKVKEYVDAREAAFKDANSGSWSDCQAFDQDIAASF